MQCNQMTHRDLIQKLQPFDKVVHLRLALSRLASRKLGDPITISSVLSKHRGIVGTSVFAKFEACLGNKLRTESPKRLLDFLSLVFVVVKEYCLTNFIWYTLFELVAHERQVLWQNSLHTTEFSQTLVGVNSQAESA